MPRSLLVVAIAAAGLGFTAVAATATAGADPGPVPAPPIPLPAEEAAPPPADLLSAAFAAGRQNPVAAMGDLIGSSTSPVMVFGQSLAQGAPGGGPLAAAPTLFPQYYRMPTPDMESPYLLTQNAPAGPFARVDAFKGVHALVHGALGRMPADQLGDPLPGTAPPPGTALPAGPEQFLPPPPDPAIPGAPVIPVIPVAPGG